MKVLSCHGTQVAPLFVRPIGEFRWLPRMSKTPLKNFNQVVSINIKYLHCKPWGEKPGRREIVIRHHFNSIWLIHSFTKEFHFLMTGFCQWQSVYAGEQYVLLQTNWCRNLISKWNQSFSSRLCYCLSWRSFQELGTYYPLFIWTYYENIVLLAFLSEIPNERT